MERGFYKISFEQFCKDICNDNDLYLDYKLPKRASSFSCGYDFISFRDIILHPGEIVKIPTGYKVKLNDDEFLMLVVRSSMGFKYNVRMCNQVGIIDSDYYDNSDNEGHIWVALQNEGDKDYIIEKGTAYTQAIFMKYLTCGDEVNNSRIGGIGSTDGKRKKDGE